ncbi:caspase-8 isoform X2 [Pseudoliparis swirei]|uniref:caspase-8 isoform X2 n=1 Tax=Pseudoliparis swirei TaxID=2059687 RepID=UPI0024BE2932|nr:caspase-8 isoform X2 [Pseudoliparis swirei]
MEFQRLLLDVGKALNKDEVKALAFLCTEILNQNLTSVESAGDLFSRLGDQDRLSAERPYLLTELLLIIQRRRLIRDLGLSDGASTTRSLISPYRKLLYNLSEKMTDEDLKNVKFLLNRDLPRRKLEGNSTLEVFLEMERMALISDTNLNLLEEIFHSVCPMLNNKISRFKELQEPHTGPGVQETTRQRSKSCPLEPDQVPQSLNLERTASCELPEKCAPLAEYNMNTSNISNDLLNVSHGGDDCVALSRELSGLNTDTSLCDSLEVNVDAQENKASETQTSQTTNTNNEALGIYPMTAQKRGICLIVNNHNFNPLTSLQKREGTLLDEESLRSVFAWLGFVVEIKTDCTSTEMLSALRELGSRNHSLMDCVVCCILSHGKDGGVYGVDGSLVAIKDLKKPFNGSNCASLVDKPKLFFIQACQGTGQQKAVTICADGPACSDDFIEDDSIPSDADFLLAMATVPSFVSWRDKKNGSWFIQSVCQNLLQMVPRGCDLVSILTKVNADVSQKTDSAGERTPMPQPAFSLRKKVVFPIPEAPPPSLLH